jgi:hypothetical protein
VDSFAIRIQHISDIETRVADLQIGLGVLELLVEELLSGETERKS